MLLNQHAGSFPMLHKQDLESPPAVAFSFKERYSMLHTTDLLPICIGQSCANSAFAGRACRETWAQYWWQSMSGAK